MAPQYDYFEQVFLPVASRFGFAVEARAEARGYYPRGGGVVMVRTEPVQKLQAVTLTDRGDITTIRVRAFHAGQVQHAKAQTMVDVAQATINAAHPSVQITVDVVEEQHAVGNGSGILIVAETNTGCRFGGSALGGGKDGGPESVGRKAAAEVLDALESGGCVDEWLQDQLILFMALAHGTSEMVTGALTLHTKTAIMHATDLCGASFDVQPLSLAAEPTAAAAAAAVAAMVVGGQGLAGIASCAGVRAGAGVSSDHGYGTNGREEGRFLIRCRGIGFSNSHLG
jgi:RNA 3'-terminal phosphate cyclase (ATP)